MSIPKPYWNPVFSVPAVLNFVNPSAAAAYECRNRDTKAARKRPINPQNLSLSRDIQRWDPSGEWSKMAGNPHSMSEDELEDELVATEIADSEARSERLREHLKTSERLNEYYIQVVAELRASLDEIERREQAS
jgi:hypothetical protein